MHRILTAFPLSLLNKQQYILIFWVDWTTTQIISRSWVSGWSYSHSTAESTGLRAAAVRLGLLGNDERLFTGVGGQSVDRVMGVGQGAAVPHRGLSDIHDLITYGLLVVAITERQTESHQESHRQAKQWKSWGGEGGGAVRWGEVQYRKEVR